MRRAHLLSRLPAALVSFAFTFSFACNGDQQASVPKDDWAYTPYVAAPDSTGSGPTLAMGAGGASAPRTAYSAPGPSSSASVPMVAPSSSGSFANTSGAAVPPAAGGGNLGYSTGGAKDIANFRENIKNGYLPLNTDVTYEGVFYDYYFDTGATAECNALFCPSYVPMLSTDPFTGSAEPFISVGLNSGIKESDFARKKLNLVVVLDVSGSMGSRFDSYYYDLLGKKVDNTENSSKTKLALAAESIVAMLAHLKAGDRFGMVLFTDDAFLAKPLSLVEETDIAAIGRHILELTALDGTNMEAGYKMGADMLAKLGAVDPATYENRIILLTDAMPNMGGTGEGTLAAMVANSAAARAFTTFIGIGVDFNSSLIETITKTKGANYYSVHGSKEFKQRMDEEFDFMVTPMVFNLKLALQSDAFAIKNVYGSPEAAQATGELIFVNTLFPSKVENGKTKGGVILALLEQTGASNQIKLSATYEDRNGVAAANTADFAYAAGLDEVTNPSVYKAILLVRYVRLLKDWIQSERQNAAKLAGSAPGSGWERQSLPLTVSSDYRLKFQVFSTHLKDRMALLADPTLSQEIAVLDKLAQ